MGDARIDDDGSLAPATTVDPLIGTVIEGKYVVLRLLGAGGMGAVYEANHRVIGKRVAVKVLHREFCTSSDIVQRFQREARAATAIGHPNIVDIFDMGTMAGGGFFQVLELLEGRSLADEIHHGGPLSYARAVHILSQVAEALAATHEKGVVHRDLKPDNVFLVTRNGQPDFVKLLDFGVAKVMDANTGAKTRTGMAIGTPSYMSPEQAQGQSDVDHRTDVFALGVMTFEMLAAALPFEAESFAMTIFQLCVADTPQLSGYREDVPAGLQAVLETMLQKNKENRFADCRQVKAALAPFAKLDEAPRMRGVPAERAPIPISAIKRIAADQGPIGFAKTVATQPAGGPEASVTGPLAAIQVAPSPESVPAPTAPASSTPAPIASVVASPSPAAPDRMRALIAVVALAVVLVVGAVYMMQPPAPAVVAPTPVIEQVRIAIRAEPLAAALFVDEHPVSNPYVVELAASGDAHMIEARLDGYSEVQRAVTFDGPVDITLALAPLAELPTAPIAEEPPPPVVPPPSTAPHGHGHAPPPPVAVAPTPPPVVATPPPPPPEPEPEVPARALKTVIF